MHAQYILNQYKIKEEVQKVLPPRKCACRKGNSIPDEAVQAYSKREALRDKEKLV